MPTDRNEIREAQAREMADAVLKEAKQRAIVSVHGNIQCKHGKSISYKKLVAIFQRHGIRASKASSAELKAAGFETCCFTIFRELAGALVRD